MKHQMYVSLLPKGLPSETPVQIPVDGVEHGEAIISAFGLHTLDDASIFVHHPDIENGASPYQEICDISEIRKRLGVKNQTTVTWDLYKESGKWAYGGKATFDVPKGFIDDAQLLKLVATAPDQNQVHPNTILDRHYMIVIKETEETMNNPAYQGFLCRAIHQKGSAL